MEARVALTRPPNVSNVKVDGASAAPAASVAPTSSNISGHNQNKDVYSARVM